MRSKTFFLSVALLLSLSVLSFAGQAQASPPGDPLGDSPPEGMVIVNEQVVKDYEKAYKDWHKANKEMHKLEKKARAYTEAIREAEAKGESRLVAKLREKLRRVTEAQLPTAQKELAAGQLKKSALRRLREAAGDEAAQQVLDHLEDQIMPWRVRVSLRVHHTYRGVRDAVRQLFRRGGAKGKGGKIAVGIGVGIGITYLLVNRAEAAEQVRQFRQDFIKDIQDGGGDGRATAAAVLDRTDWLLPVNIPVGKLLDRRTDNGDTAVDAAFENSGFLGTVGDLIRDVDTEVPFKRVPSGSDEGTEAKVGDSGPLLDSKDGFQGNHFDTVGVKDSVPGTPEVGGGKKVEAGGLSDEQLGGNKTVEQLDSGDVGQVDRDLSSEQQDLGSPEQLGGVSGNSSGSGVGKGSGETVFKGTGGSSEKEKFAAAYGSSTGGEGNKESDQGSKEGGSPGGSGGNLGEADVTDGVDVVTGADGGKEQEGDSGSSEGQVDCAEGGCGSADHPGQLGMPNPDDGGDCGKGCRTWLNGKHTFTGRDSLVGLVGDLVSLLSSQSGITVLNLVADWGEGDSERLPKVDPRGGGLFGVFEGLLVGALGSGDQGSASRSGLGVLGLVDLVADWGVDGNDGGPLGGGGGDGPVGRVGTVLNKADGDGYDGRAPGSPRGASTVAGGHRTGAVRTTAGTRTAPQVDRSVRAVQQRGTVQAPTAVAAPQTQKLVAPQAPTVVTNTGPITQTQSPATKLSSPSNATSQVQSPTSHLSNSE